MKWLFDSDSLPIKFLSRTFDMLLIAVLTILCSILFITVGAAMSAMYDVTIRIVLDRDNGILKPYFRAFAKNFKKGTLIWLICLTGLVFVGANFYLLTVATEGLPEGVKIGVTLVVLIVTVLVGFVVIYAFPLQARYENSVITTLKNALFISIAQFPRSIGLLFANAVALFLGWIAPGVIPLVLVAEFSLVTYITAYNMVKVFVALGDKDAVRDATIEDDFHVDIEESEQNSEL